MTIHYKILRKVEQADLDTSPKFVKAECTMAACCTKLGLPSVVKDNSLSLFRKHGPNCEDATPGACLLQ